MKFDVVVGNPPYDKNLHLKIINTVIKFLEPDGTGCFIHPARWLQDPLWEYKKNCDHRRFMSIVERLKDVKFINVDNMFDIFDISYNGDLMISIISSEPTMENVDIYNSLAQEAVECILKYSIEHNLKQVADKVVRDGWRCQINGIIPIVPNSHGGSGEYGRKKSCNIFAAKKNNVYFNGYNKDGKYWTETINKNKHSKDIGSPFPYSIKFKTEDEARNFESSCNTNFYNNIMFLLKLDQQTPLAYLPWMGDYSHPWTDEDYCCFFEKYGMSKECQEWMCREVYDYRVKDFIDYKSYEV